MNFKKIFRLISNLNHTPKFLRSIKHRSVTQTVGKTTLFSYMFSLEVNDRCRSYEPILNIEKVLSRSILKNIHEASLTSGEISTKIKEEHVKIGMVLKFMGYSPTKDCGFKILQDWIHSSDEESMEGFIVSLSSIYSDLQDLWEEVLCLNNSMLIDYIDDIQGSIGDLSLKISIFEEYPEVKSYLNEKLIEMSKLSLTIAEHHSEYEIMRI